MKVSILIELLLQLEEEHGDVPVKFADSNDVDTQVRKVTTCDRKGTLTNSDVSYICIL